MIERFYIGEIELMQGSNMSLLKVLPKKLKDYQIVNNKEMATCYNSFEKAQSAIKNLKLDKSYFGIYCEKEKLNDKNTN